VEHILNRATTEETWRRAMRQRGADGLSGIDLVQFVADESGVDNEAMLREVYSTAAEVVADPEFGVTVELLPPEQIRREEKTMDPGLHLCLQNWKDNFPAEYKRMEEAGTLLEHAEAATQRYAEVLSQGLNRGLCYHQAQELAQPEWGQPPTLSGNSLPEPA